MDPATPPHAVQSVDWYHPTLGELGFAGEDPDERARQRETTTKREGAEEACRVALASKPKLLSRFYALLEVAQRYAVLRERQARDFTLAWPLLRRCAIRLGETLAARGAIDAAEDVFFLTRAELDGRATGRVRIVRGPEDFRDFRDGEVLVARLTAPAWTPLFGRAAAVVTDGGTLAAHASLVVREYGIPAVVGTSDATHRLRDGQVVIVGGGAGVVEMDR
jgi:rifampicin phosphotransferase